MTIARGKKSGTLYMTSDDFRSVAVAESKEIQICGTKDLAI